jgi:hypothetical protein
LPESKQSLSTLTRVSWVSSKGAHINHLTRFTRSVFLAAGVVFSIHQAASALDGKIVDATTGAAIGDAVVTLGGSPVKSTADGRFHVDGSAAEVQARAAGYRATAVAVSALASSNGTIRLTRFEPKALYLTVYGIGSKALRDGALKLIREGHANALVIDIKGDRGLVNYPSAVPLVSAVGARKLTTISDLPALVQSLHSTGIYAIARIVVFKDDPLANAKPELAVKLPNGRLFRDREHLAWVDPFQHAVWDYNISIAVEAARAGFDEIQFDYLRFPDSPQSLRLAKPANRASRVEAIRGFLAEAKRRLTPYNVFLAADFFGYVCWNLDDTGIGQQLAEIAESADYLSPMLYPSGFQFGIPGYKNPVSHPYEIVRRTLDEAREQLNIPAKRFRPWLQAFKDYAFDRRLFDADEVAAQIKAAKDFGADGWMLWNAHNTYEGAGLAALNPTPQEVQSWLAQEDRLSPESSSCF